MSSSARKKKTAATRRAGERVATKQTSKPIVKASVKQANSSLDALLASREMILVVGSGGVGKTTIAAALGLAAVQRQPGKVLVLTIDPARRLATALGLESLGNMPVKIDGAAFAEVGVPVRGELYVAMLDTKAGWDELIHRHAPDAATRKAVLANPLYQNITSRFVRSHDYLAMEQLHDLHATGDYDLVIVDTPPSRNALTILDAPSRMADFFGSRLLRWLTVPYRSRLFTFASKPFYQVADRVLGSRFLQDIADFFVLFQAMESGFVKRAKEVDALLVDPRTAFIVVSTLEAAPAHEAKFLAESLIERRMSIGAIVANRVLPASLGSAAAAAAADELLAATAEPAGGAIAAAIGAEMGTDAALVGRVLHSMAERFDDVAMVASREADRRLELTSLATTTVSVPWLDGDIHDLEGLGVIAGHLRGTADRAESQR
jgi:anion-transporting  ArsA/GET3 family ATPase